MKNKKFKDYVANLIKEFPEIFDEFNESMDNLLDSPETLVDEVCNFSDILDKNYFNQEIVSEFKASLRKKEYSEAYYIVLNEYSKANMSITVTCKLDSKRFSRHFMIPLRTDISDFIAIILGSFRLSDFDASFVVCGNCIFSPTLLNDNVLNGKNYLIQNFVFYKKIKLICGKYVFDIRIRKNKYSNIPELPFTLEKTSGNYLLSDYDDMIKFLNGEGVSENSSEILDADITTISIFSHMYLSIFEELLEKLEDDIEEEVVS